MSRTACLVACLFVAVPLQLQAGESSRLNVVLIVTDDHGFGDIGWNNPDARTPHLDRLAREGVRLDRFYVNPICSVTRGALLTGIASAKTGVGNSTGLDLKYRILPQAFHDAGYQTWMCGKWHLGGPADSQRSGVEYYPHSRGFEQFYGHLGGAIDYFTHIRKDTGELDWQRSGKVVEEEGFSTDLLVDDAVRKIQERDATRPFLLYLAFNAVHGPLQPPPSATELSRRDRRAVLLANLSHMDAAVGRLLSCLDEEHLHNDTLVLFFGDNGGQINQGASNGPLRGEKGATFEGGIRVPAAIRLPDVLPRGITSQQFLCAMDVFPTLCAATGIQTDVDEQLDGVDLWEALSRNELRKRPPFVMGNKDVACFAPPWKLVVPGRGESPLLFNIVDDPKEQRDEAASHPEIVAELSKEIPMMKRGGGGGKNRRVPDSKGRQKMGEGKQRKKQREVLP